MQPVLEPKTFNITSVRIFKPDGYFVAETEEGEIVKGVSIFPPYGEFNVKAQPVPDKYSVNGKAWKVRTIEFDHPDKITRAMLGSGMINGIKEVKADAVFETFGSDIWMILEAAAKNFDPFGYTPDPIEYKGETVNPLKLLESIHGVGEFTANLMVESWVEQRDTFMAQMNAVRCGFDAPQFRKFARTKEECEIFNKMLFEKDGHSIYDLVTLGIEFDKVDKIAMQEWPDKPAIDRYSLKRFAGVAKLAIYKAKNEGHMCLPIEEVDLFAMELIGTAVMPYFEGDFSKFGLHVYRGMVYDKRGYAIETGISTKLREIMREPFRALDITDMDILDAFDFEPDPLQIDAIKMVLKNKVSILTGGPGTGKTTILKVLVKLLQDQGEEVHLCAFMGSAARRMKIATGHPAHTLHSYFGLNSMDKNAIYGGWLFVDEMSTVPSDLAYDFLKQCGKDVHVIFIGDVDQLPPVGSGEVFVQLLETKNIPRTRLQTLFRNGGVIAQACRDVNEGRMPTADNINFFLATKSRDEKFEENLKKAEKYFDDHGWPRAQLLTPLNEWRHKLNAMFRKMRNPDGLPIPFTEIQVGDQVVQEKNIYRSLYSNLDVRNGMIGKVISRSSMAEMILSSFAMGKTEKDLSALEVDWLNIIMSVMFEDEEYASDYQRIQLETIGLGYCITIHKSQGNQFDSVFVVIPSNVGQIANRQLIYTAMSRAKKYLFVMAAPGAMEACIANATKALRYTKLAAFIDGG